MRPTRLLALVSLPSRSRRHSPRQRANTSRPSSAGGGSHTATDRDEDFLSHAGLPAEKAEDLLKRLEVMLTIISKYWGQPNRSTIELYVVEDLAEMAADGVLHPDGLQASARRRSDDRRAHHRIRRRQDHAKAVVYAVADHGTPRREAVPYAYCGRTSARPGPTCTPRDGRNGQLLAGRRLVGRVARGRPAIPARSEPKPLLGDRRQHRPDRRRLAELPRGGRRSPTCWRTTGTTPHGSGRWA